MPVSLASGSRPAATGSRRRRPLRGLWLIVRFIASGLRGEAAAEIVVPRRDPPAQAGDRRLVKTVFGEGLIGKPADSGAISHVSFLNEVRIRRARRGLKSPLRFGNSERHHDED